MIQTASSQSHGTLHSLMRLFTANDPPSDTQLVSLKALQQDIEAGFSVAINRRCRCGPLKSLHESLKCATSPIRRLPDELVSEIFFMSMSYRYKCGWNSLEFWKGPWTFTKVSKRWRAIALADQRLWSSIVVDASWEASQALALCLARSPARALALRFEWRPKLRSLCLLILFSERWRCLSLSHIHRSDAARLNQIRGRIPELHELEFYGTPFEEGTGPYYIDAFEVAPNLQIATVYLFPVELERHRQEDMTPWVDPSRLILPWGQITRLETDSLEIFRRCEGLIECELYIPNKHKNTLQHVMTTDPITFPFLRTFKTNAKKILDTVVTPSLEWLSFEGHIDYNSCSRIHSLVARSHCRLKTLDVSQSTFKHGHHGRHLPRLMVYCSDLNIVLAPRTFWRIPGILEVVVLPPTWHVHQKPDGRIIYRRDLGQDYVSQ